MNKQVNPARRFLAFVLTVFVVPAIIVSLFVLPVEIIALNQESYSELLNDAHYISLMKPVISEIVTDQVLFVGEIPPVLADTRAFKTLLPAYLPEEWVSSVLAELVGNTLNYFNFQTPYAAIELSIDTFKDSLTKSSNAIAGEYVISLESCQVSDLAMAETAQTLADYPACKPGANDRAALASLIAVYLEDRVNRLPNTLNLVGLVPSGMLLGERSFYWYSIARWLFRLLPFITLLLLLFIALLLKPSKKLMRAWIGWTLLIVSGFVLVASVVILIGRDQFIGLLFNRSFALLIAGFGNVLLAIVRFISNRIVVWVIAQAAAVFLFGLILMLAAKYSREKLPSGSDEQQEVEQEPVEENPEKTIVPQTMEEIEQEEQENGTSD